MKFKKSILLLGLFVASNAFADLSQYSSEELMQEVGRRIDDLDGGSGGGSGTNSFLLNFTCNNHIMKMTMISQNASAVHDGISNNNSDECKAQKAKLEAKYPGNITGFKVVDVCAYHIQHTLKVTAKEITLLGSISHNNTSECLKAVGLN